MIAFTRCTCHRPRNPGDSSRRARCAVGAAPTSLVQGPPPGYDFRTDVKESTQSIVGTRHPDLLDLVADGTMVVWERPASYVERREDGYQEPKLVYLVGTAHVSQKSAVDVDRVIRAVHPDAVVVELCKSRTGIMDEKQQQQHSITKSTNLLSGSTAGSTTEEAGNGQLKLDSQLSQQSVSHSSNSSASDQLPGPGPPSLSPNMLQLSGQGSGFLPALQRSVQLGGQSALLLRVLLAKLAGLAADQLGVQGGGEFVAARKAAESEGAQIVLGDRPIEITLQRAWDGLPWSQRFRLCWELMLAGTTQSADREALLTEQLMESMKQDDAISSFFQQLSARYPELLAPLVHERDMYLAWSLKRSKAVNGASAVVGVVGRGHMRGVVYALSHDSGNLRFKDLVGGKNSKEGRRTEALLGVAKLAAETVLFAALFYAWTELHS